MLSVFKSMVGLHRCDLFDGGKPSASRKGQCWTSNVFGNTTHFFAQSNQQLCVKPWLLCSIEIFKLTLVVYLQFIWSIQKLQSLHTLSKGVPGFRGSAVVGLFNLIPQLHYLFICLFVYLLKHPECVLYVCFMPLVYKRTPIQTLHARDPPHPHNFWITLGHILMLCTQQEADSFQIGV